VVLEQVTGKWICELPELKGMRQSDIEHIKVFASRNEDSARMAYGRLPVVRKRQCIFIGTTNALKFLKDETGNRRWWPIRVTRIDIDRLKCDVDQLWSEAAVAEAKGESITLDETLWSAAADVQEVHRIEEPWVDVLGAELGDKHGKIMSVDVWKILGVETGRQTPWDNTRMGQAMRELGWTPSQRHFGTGRKKSAYVKGTPVEQRAIIYVFRDPITRVVSVRDSAPAEDVPF
jgi:predicted P-loop ATPase